MSKSNPCAGLGLIASVLVLSGLAAGCGQGSQTPLPELTRVSRPLLSPDEQARAIRNMEAERAKLAGAGVARQGQ